MPAGSAESRSLDLSREFSPYEFGDIAWKERVESWKIKQEKNQMAMTDTQTGGGGSDMDDNRQNGDAPMYHFWIIPLH
jgi:cellulose synthase A